MQSWQAAIRSPITFILSYVSCALCAFNLALFHSRYWLVFPFVSFCDRCVRCQKFPFH